MLSTPRSDRPRPRRHQVRLAAAVVLFPVLLLAAAACGSSNKTASSTPGSSSAASSSNAGGGLYGAPASSAPAAGSASAPAGGPVAPAAGSPSVKVASVGKFGQILVDADGNTLYLFEADHGTTTACTASCLSTWPPATATSPAAGPGVDGSQLSTTNGAAPNQLVYHGHLLYRFAGDHAPGDVNGASIPKWYPVSPSGDAVDNS